ncbi:nucleoid-associated protein [Rodentibacter haemolyticus]|uniref:Nucleoid-associated protein n=1 Tax=Rodentibacter haemolyticus TaxID=2778911 RepID=A0ABX6UXE3_9PAST|nr:nucleoid-associated protein [Rodentibacter haemolyticus]QPB42758.1 nucleoid-associated protein [Rodentibacter haemolyticus]
MVIESLDLSAAKVRKVIVHKVGNKFRDEGVLLSEAESKRSSDLDDLLLKHFLIPVVNSGEEYTLTHESDINLNPIKHYSSLVFNDKDEFINSSIAIAKHLYMSSSHPNIGGGEFIEVLYDGIKNGDMTIQAIGLFRIENKNNYLDVNSHDGVISIIEKEGISIDSIQKGAIILSIEDSVFIIDSLGKKTKYWLDTFIKVAPKNTSKKYTRILGEITKAIAKKIEVPSKVLDFSESLSEESVFSVENLKKISSNFVDESEIDSIIDGVGVKYGVLIDKNFSLEKERLSKYIKETGKRVQIAKGVNIVISEPNTKITSVEIISFEAGFKAIINIQEGK